MADSRSGPKSTSSTQAENVIQAPTRRATRLTTDEDLVTTEQNYDSSSEPKGLGKEGITQVGDPVTLSPRHQKRAEESD